MKKILIPLFTLSSTLLSALIIGLIPDGGKHNEFNAAPFEPSEVNHPYWAKALRSRLFLEGHLLIGAHSQELGIYDVVVFENCYKCQSREQLQYLDSLNCTKILFMWEPPTVCPPHEDITFLDHFDKVITYNDALLALSQSKYYRYYYHSNRGMLNNLPSFDDRLHSCMILSNKSSTHPEENYSERLRLINFYESFPDGPGYFNLYGHGWEKYNLECYYGKAPSTSETIQYYKFCFAYENWLNDRGYITEKIFAAFMAGSVPIYLGATNIEEYIPKECYISFLDFSSYADLHEFLINMPEEDWISYQNNIRIFLASEMGQRFTTKKLTDIIFDCILDE